MTPFPRRRALTRAALAAASLVSVPAAAATFRWEPTSHPLFARWDNDHDWNPDGIPGAADDVLAEIRADSIVLDQNHAARNVTLLNADLQVGNNRLTVGDTLRLQKLATSTHLPTVWVFDGAAVQLISDRIELANGGRLEMWGGLVRVNDLLQVGDDAAITGAGVIEFTPAGRPVTVLTLDGEISTAVRGADNKTLVFRRTGSDGTGVLSFSGSPGEIGRVNVLDGDSILSVQMPLADFNGVMQIGRGNGAVFTHGFDVGPRGQLLLSVNDGGQLVPSSVIAVGGSTISGTVHARFGTSNFGTAATFTPTAAVAVDNGGTLRLNVDTTYQGGTFTGQGALVQNADATVTGETHISVDRYDWDGESESRSTTINSGGHLRLSSIALDDESPPGHDGGIKINGGGRLTVETGNGWVMRSTLSMQNGTSAAPARLLGRRMLVSGNGAITVSGSGLMENEGIWFRDGTVVDTAGGAASLTVTGSFATDAGTHVKAGAGVLSIEGTQQHAVGSELDVNGGTVRMTTSPSGAGAGNLALTVAGGARVELNAPGRSAVSSLFITFDGQTSLSGGGNKTLVTRSLTVRNQQGGSAGELDLHDNALVVDYSGAPSPLAGHAALLARGYNAGAWDGLGIDSSSAAADPAGRTALGIAEASDVLGVSGAQTATFRGGAADASSVLIAFTLYGDANLNGAVGFEDLVRLAQNYGTTGKIWSQGDFTYDGNVDFQDLVRLAQNYDTALPAELASFGPEFRSDFAAALALVPEPGAELALAGAAVALRQRRRWRRIEA